MQPTSTPVLFIVGPTAVGKTGLAVALARRLNGEIVNADSRQVYRYMDIGTAKPSPEELAQAPHHLLDIVDPGINFDLASFLSLARGSIQDIRSRVRLPVVAGGSGQYVWALIEGWQVPKVPPDPAFRREKQQEADLHGPMPLYRQLQEADPGRAAQLDPRNVRRVIRALEVCRSPQRAASDLQGRTQPMENVLVIGLTIDREELYQRIDDRVDRMMAAGLLEEVRNLDAMGYRMGQGPLASPGYRELGQHLAGEITLDEAVQRTKYQTHRLARRQHTWFKPDDGRIRWLDASGPGLEASAELLAAELLSGRYDTIGTPRQEPGR
ncbi:MAG: tRNA (adenosine(37)-N6)-dimethylallyltransferase MiaA [Dehalococcoidia bacterium]|nr:tRNA (adenosine(37)-N6)-dimethylallyltransferase MiaA [Dehalococcoidia bacterium]